MKNILDRFWQWYNKYYLFALTVTTFLFLLQLFHLYWLFMDVILQRLIGESYFFFPPFWGVLSILLDYTEIPALISTSLVYLNELRQSASPRGIVGASRRTNWRDIIFLFLLNIQWLHLFWITDAVVIEHFNGNPYFHWSVVIAWIAIIIDYAELPVMYDTAKKTVIEIKKTFKP